MRCSRRVAFAIAVLLTLTQCSTTYRREGELPLAPWRPVFSIDGDCLLIDVMRDGNVVATANMSFDGKISNVEPLPRNSPRIVDRVVLPNARRIAASVARWGDFRDTTIYLLDGQGLPSRELVDGKSVAAALPGLPPPKLGWKRRLHLAPQTLSPDGRRLLFAVRVIDGETTGALVRGQIHYCEVAISERVVHCIGHPPFQAPGTASYLADESIVLSSYVGPDESIDRFGLRSAER